MVAKRLKSWSFWSRKNQIQGAQFLNGEILNGETGRMWSSGPDSDSGYSYWRAHARCIWYFMMNVIDNNMSLIYTISYDQLGNPTGVSPLRYAFKLRFPCWMGLLQGLLRLTNLFEPFPPHLCHRYIPSKNTILCEWCVCRLPIAYDILYWRGR